MSRPTGRDSKSQEGEGGVVATVDIGKASDTVPHSAFLSPLKDKGIHQLITDIISSMYDGFIQYVKNPTNAHKFAFSQNSSCMFRPM
jgi:hypothetical protein